MRRAGADEKGDVKSTLVTASVFLVAAALLAALFRWYFQTPVPAPGPPPTVASSAGAFKGDPAEATQKLLKALNEKLQSMDLLKLLTREVETIPVTVQQNSFLTYRETFRMPLSYSAEELGRQLGPVSKALGAVMDQDGGSCDFVFEPGWTAVRIVFQTVRSPRVCLIIDDGGYQKGGALDHLYGFKVPITVAIIPDAEFSKSLAEEFPAHGVEVMCHMPMEGHEKGMVGGNYKEILKKGMNDAKVRAEVEEALTGLPHCRGLNNHMGSVATTDPELIWDVCQVLKSRGLFIIDSRTTAQSVVEPVAKKAGLPVAHRDVFLDNVETPDAILKQLDQLVTRAKRKGLAVGIGHFKTVTLETLEQAIPDLKKQEIQFVYASEVVK